MRLKIVSDGIKHAVVCADTGTVIEGIRRVNVDISVNDMSMITLEMINMDVEIEAIAGFDTWFKIYRYEATKHGVPVNESAPEAYMKYFNDGITPAIAVQLEQ